MPLLFGYIALALLNFAAWLWLLRHGPTVAAVGALLLAWWLLPGAIRARRRWRAWCAAELEAIQRQRFARLSR